MIPQSINDRPALVGNAQSTDYLLVIQGSMTYKVPKSALSDWGAIGGSIANQTDLQIKFSEVEALIPSIAFPLAVNKGGTGVGAIGVTGQNLLAANSPSAARTTLGVSSTDAVTVSSFVAILTAVTSSNVTSYPIAGNFYNHSIVNSGFTNPGQNRALSGLCYRNNIAVGTDDSGVLGTLYGLLFEYGHWNTNPTATPQTTNVFGIHLSYHCRTGQVGTTYGLYAPPGYGEGITGTNYTLYLSDSLAKNYIQGQTGIGTSGFPASAQLDIVSTTRGFKPPSHTTAQQSAIASPVAGLQNHNTDLARPCFYNGIAWRAVADATLDKNVQLRSYTVATLPSASANTQCLINVSDGVSSKRLAISDGTAWRWPDGLTVS